MEKIIIVMLTLCIYCNCVAEESEVSGIKWTYSIKENLCKICGVIGVEPEVAFSTKNTIGSVFEIPNEIDGYKVTEIGIGAVQFAKGGSPELLVLPQNIKRISGAFVYKRGCVNAGQFGPECWRVYDAVSSLQTTNILFLGDVPCVDVYSSYGSHTSGDGWSYVVSPYGSPITYYAHIDVGSKGQFGGCGCWYVEGRNGWNMEHFCGSEFVKCGAVETTFVRDDVDRMKVELSCINKTATIYYTLNGEKPIVGAQSCFKYTQPFTLEHASIVKAIAVVEDYPYTIVTESDYNLGNVNNPQIQSTCGTEFYASHNMVSLLTETIDAVIRYTLDDSPVTKDSPVYTAPFAISDTTMVRAKAFKEDWVDSEEVVQTFTRLWYTNETPVIEAAAETFVAASQSVTLSCETDGATIYYTLDGTEPSATNGRIYTGPFDIYQTTTVKAIAVKDDWKDSAVVSATFTKENTIGPAINLLEMLPDNDKTHPWEVVTDVTHDGVCAVKSGTIKDEESTTLKAVIYGAGRLSFWWRTSCEPSIDGEYYDFATFFNGTTEIVRLAGVSDWQQVTLNVSGTGKHTFKWTYQKDDSGSTVPDGMWLDQVQWLPQTDDYYSTHTLTTETPVPYTWLDKYELGRLTDFETAAKAKSGKTDGAGRELTVEDEYIAGTDPTNMTSHLQAKIEMVDGTPIIKWSPDWNEAGAKTLRDYKVWGKEALDDGNDWEYPTNGLHRFFKVTVEMPK